MNSYNPAFVNAPPVSSNNFNFGGDIERWDRERGWVGLPLSRKKKLKLLLLAAFQRWQHFISSKKNFLFLPFGGGVVTAVVSIIITKKLLLK